MNSLKNILTNKLNLEKFSLQRREKHIYEVLNNHKTIIIAKTQFPQMIDSETHGLDQLSAFINTPQILFKDDNWLLLEYISSGSEDTTGDDLLSLHQQSRVNKEYGLERDNFIGPTQQINNPNKSWSEFFTANRLNFQISILKKNGLINSTNSNEFEKALTIAKKLLPDNFTPSLCHGDLWHGNIINSIHGYTVLIDPAIYYGDPYSDLAMLFLFSPVKNDLLNLYKKSLKIPFNEKVMHIYQLYHLMNHVNIFGSSYMPQTIRCLRKINE